MRHTDLNWYMYCVRCVVDWNWMRSSYCERYERHSLRLKTYEDQVRDRLRHVWSEGCGRLVLDEE